MTGRVSTTFWVLLVTAVVAVGGLSRGVERGDRVGIILAGVAGLVACVAVLLDLRILIVVHRHERNNACE